MIILGMNDYTWDEFIEQVYTACGWKFNPSTLYKKVASRGKIDIFIQNPTTGNTRGKIQFVKTRNRVEMILKTVV